MLDLPEILDMFTTLTPYGEKKKKKLHPFSPEQQEELVLELAELKGIIKFIQALPKGKTQELKDLMQQLPFIQPELEYLRVKATLNSPMLFNLAKFLFLAKEINHLLETAGWWDNARVRWQLQGEAYRLLKITANYRFYLGNFGDKAYQALVQEIQLMEKELTGLVASLEDQVLQELGLMDKSFNNGLFVAGRSDSKLVEKLLEDKRLVIFKENFAAVTFKRVANLAEQELRSKITQAKDRLTVLEQALLENLSIQLAVFLEYFAQLADKIGRLDWLLARGFFAVTHGGIVPEVFSRGMGGKNRLVVMAGIHPIVQTKLKQLGTDFVPVSIDLEAGVALLTGANMGGKTITLKTVGTLLAMAQLGLPVTAAKVEVNLADFIFFSTAGERNPVGLSNFGAEIQAVNEILRVRDKQGLVLLDEPARGTNPEEGAALAHAFLKAFQQGNCVVLVTTHFDSLIKEESFVQWQVKGLRNLTSLHNLHNLADIYHSFDYGLEKITSREKVPRDALKVARLMKVDEQVLQLAEKYLTKG
jgi:DNA mismatch repair ATPase MutS